MAKVYRVYAQMEYTIEVIAQDSGDAEEIALQMAPSKWDTNGLLYTSEIEKVSNDANEWFGPDRSDEI